MNRELRTLILVVALLSTALLITGCVEDKNAPSATPMAPLPGSTTSPSAIPAELQIRLSSPEFANGALIPQRFTCDGTDINPALRIENVPAGTKTLALILEDPDASRGTWVHWLVYNIPVTIWIDEDSVPGTQGRNDYGVTEYRGPCPPAGTHRYVFTLYALDAELGLDEGVEQEALARAMQAHILATAELTGYYAR
jgi:Raf kinase inhibitor-like YbhB/YbcL family protein